MAAKKTDTLQVLLDSDPDCQQAYETLCQAFEDREGDLPWLREVGLAVSTIVPARGKGRYGRELVNQLATRLVKAPQSPKSVRNLLWGARKFATVFTARQVKDLAKRRNAAAKPLSVSHAMCLAGIEDEPRRDKLIEKWEEESLGVRELRDQAQERLGRRRSHGRRPARNRGKLKSPTVALQEIRLRSRTWSECFQVCFEQPPKPLTWSSMRAKRKPIGRELKQTRDVLKELAENVRKARTELKAVAAEIRAPQR